MPSKPAPPFWMLRVTTDDHAWVVEKLLKDKRTLCCSEVGSKTEKPHIHCILFESKSTTWRRLKEAGYKGSKDFAYSQGGTREEDLPNALRYICKGVKDERLVIPPTILYNTMELTDDEILEYQRQYWDHVETQKEMEKRKVYKGKDGKEKVETRIGPCLCAKADEEFGVGSKPTTRQLISFTITFFGGQQKCFDMPYVKKYVHLLLYHFYGERYVRKATEELVRHVDLDYLATLPTEIW